MVWLENELASKQIGRNQLSFNTQRITTQVGRDRVITEGQLVCCSYYAFSAVLRFIISNWSDSTFCYL